MLRLAGSILIVALCCFVLISQNVYSLPAEDIEIINNRDYFPRVHELFKNAKKSIYIMMFSAHYYDKYPNSPSNILFRDLVAAKKRGLDVKVILEQNQSRSGGLFGGGRVQPEHHQRIVEFLKKYQIEYKLDSPGVSTHAKLIIVDGLYTVVGSTNWSYSALEKNNETAVIIKSPQVAKSYIKYFKEVY